MDYEEKQHVQDIIDIAIASIAIEQWKRLAGIVRDTDDRFYALFSVEKALDSLRRLRLDGIPDYNDWDALFYLTWFQPNQINIAYEVLSGLENNLSYEDEQGCGWNGNLFGLCDGKLRIVDFGCGALAMVFALAVVAANALSKGSKVTSITVDCVDKSPAMVRIGQKAWYRFVDSLKTRHPDHPMCNIFSSIELHLHNHINSLQDSPTLVPCFVSAIHCAYSDNVADVAHDMSVILDRFKPVAVFLTTHKKKEEVLDELSLGIDNKDYDPLLTIGRVDPFFRGNLPETTKLRKELSKHLLKPHDWLTKSGVDGGFIRDYLSSWSVKWTSPKGYTFHVYLRKNIH
ncbi:MAG: hypothetical protein OXG98_04255 [Gemmatimonadetes bacterium]|nr:hypothetical protein [Gemmatimonadota bacterium]